MTWGEYGPCGPYQYRHTVEAEIDEYTTIPAPTMERALAALRGEFIATVRDIVRDAVSASDPGGAVQQQAIHSRAVFTAPEKAAVVAWEARVDAQTQQLGSSCLQAAQNAAAGKFKGAAA